MVQHSPRVLQPHLILYLLQHALGLRVISPNRHFQRQDILKFPEEVGGICVGLNYIHKGVVAWQQAGDHGELAPVVLLHELQHRQTTVMPSLHHRLN